MNADIEPEAVVSPDPIQRQSAIIRIALAAEQMERSVDAVQEITSETLRGDGFTRVALAGYGAALDALMHQRPEDIGDVLLLAIAAGERLEQLEERIFTTDEPTFEAVRLAVQGICDFLIRAHGEELEPKLGGWLGEMIRDRLVDCEAPAGRLAA